jgi:predicted DCC family thiol-disulfide oxidoreductase YuxK
MLATAHPRRVRYSDGMVTAAAVQPAEVPPVILYDGTCGLCHRSVRWILRHERDTSLQFAPLQGATAAALRVRHPNIPVDLDSVVLVDAGHVHLRSRAFLYTARYLRAPWRWGYAMRWLPAPLLDLGYRVIAAVRYRLFGRADLCDVPSPAHRVRFLP